MVTSSVYKNITKRRKFNEQNWKSTPLFGYFFVDFLVKASCNAHCPSPFQHKEDSVVAATIVCDLSHLKSPKWTSDHFWPVTRRTSVWSLKLAILLHVLTVIYDHQRIIKHQNIFVMHHSYYYLYQIQIKKAKIKDRNSIILLLFFISLKNEKNDALKFC